MMVQYHCYHDVHVIDHTTKPIFYEITMVLFCKGQTTHRAQTTQAAHTGKDTEIHPRGHKTGL